MHSIKTIFCLYTFIRCCCSGMGIARGFQWVCISYSTQCFLYFALANFCQWLLSVICFGRSLTKVPYKYFQWLLFFVFCSSLYVVTFSIYFILYTCDTQYIYTKCSKIWEVSMWLCHVCVCVCVCVCACDVSIQINKYKIHASTLRIKKRRA